MFGEPDARELELDAIYLGVLTAEKVKPLSRLEYPVVPRIMDVIQGMGLIIEPVNRLARNRNLVEHWVMARDRSLIAQYRSDFDGRLLEENSDRVAELEAWYFGYPACCAEAYARSPYAPNDLTPEEQQLLFHYACPGCEETPRLIPLYRAALEEAEAVYQELQMEGAEERGSAGRSRGCAYARWNSSHSSPSCRTTARRVPIFKSLPPQSGTGAIQSVRGSRQTR